MKSTGKYVFLLHSSLLACVLAKLEPNMLKILPIIPSSTSQKMTYYSYFILISQPIIPTLFFFL